MQGSAVQCYVQCIPQKALVHHVDSWIRLKDVIHGFLRAVHESSSQVRAQVLPIHVTRRFGCRSTGGHISQASRLGETAVAHLNRTVTGASDSLCSSPWKSSQAALNHLVSSVHKKPSAWQHLHCANASGQIFDSTVVLICTCCVFSDTSSPE